MRESARTSIPEATREFLNLSLSQHYQDPPGAQAFLIYACRAKTGSPTSILLSVLNRQGAGNLTWRTLGKQRCSTVVQQAEPEPR